jgi:hypothetical protein
MESRAAWVAERFSAIAHPATAQTNPAQTAVFTHPASLHFPLPKHHLAIFAKLEIGCPTRLSRNSVCSQEEGPLATCTFRKPPTQTVLLVIADGLEGWADGLPEAISGQTLREERFSFRMHR